MSQIPPASGADRGLVRVRIVVLFVACSIVAIAAGSIFDRPLPVLLVAPVLSTVAALVLLGRRPIVRAVGLAASIGASVVLAVIISGGDLGDIVEAFGSGVQRLVSTEWPSPERPDLIGVVAAGLALATASSQELAAHRRFHLLPLLPVLLSYLAVVGLSAPGGIDWLSLILLAVVSTVFAMLRNDGTLHDRLVLLRGERRVLPLLVVAITVVALISVPLSLSVRADPRRTDPAEQVAPLLDPIQATLALRAIEPPDDLHVVTPDGEQVLPQRWRTAALSEYDGSRWSPAVTLRPIGSTLGIPDGPVVSARVSFLDSRLTLVPLPGEPVSVDADIETDAERTVVRLASPVEPGEEIALVAELPPTGGEGSTQGVTARVVDETESPLTDLAERLAGDGSAVEQLRQLEAAMRDDFVLDNGVQGGGLQFALIERFLRDTQRGTAEQFATAFVLLAQSLGIEARVATGYVVTDAAGADDEGAIVLTSADATVWPEVQLADGEWLAFDPVPSEEASDEAPPPPEPQVQSPAAPQPPVPPPPEPDDGTTPPDDIDDAESADALSTVFLWAVRTSVALGVIMLPIALAAIAIAVAKRRRRRHRLRAARATDRIRGAWASATDVLVDAGLHIERSSTDGEIAGQGADLVADARRDLRRLATLASAATYGSPSHPELLAEDATRCLDAVETSMAAERTRWQRLRWRLSLRSLRPTTRSPVTV